jgi:hypothetical protein
MAVPIGRHLYLLPSLHLLLIERRLAEDEEIDLDGGGDVEQIHAGPLTNGPGDCALVDIELSSQPGRAIGS